MATIDFNAEVEKRKDALMEDLFTLLRINSAEDKAHANAENPFGPGPRQALDAFLAIAKRDGYETKKITTIMLDILFMKMGLKKMPKHSQSLVT